MRWVDKAKDRSHSRTLKDVSDLLEEASQLNVPANNEYLLQLRDQKQRGEAWEAKAKELMAVENVHFAQLDAFSKQAVDIPVSQETLGAIDAILKKQREAQDMILSLYERSRKPDIGDRPQYKEVRDVMEALSDLNSKPTGTIDLEKEQKRHEDWMRKGKKLFGKTNAPLHILLQHMRVVEDRNKSCFNLGDRPRMPVEPSSRSHTPEPMDDGQEDSGREVYCICRKRENGTMIECSICHEWYHSTCLKIARGKIKEEEDFVCPICDWRVKIPRDATRPKLEDLMSWQAEIATLPFQPEEEECLESIIDTAQTFRDFMTTYVNPLCSTIEEVPTQRFYLRKIEGADILLAHETNFFREELHKFVPIAPQAPPRLENSLSTRKPRPTKQQKLMAQHGVDNPDDLPQHLRTKPYSIKSKRQSRSDEKADSSTSVSGTPGSGGKQQRQDERSTSQTPSTFNFRPPLTATAFPKKLHGHGVQQSGHSASGSLSSTGGEVSLFSTTGRNPFSPNRALPSLPTMGSPMSAHGNSSPHEEPSLFAGGGAGMADFVDEDEHRRFGEDDNAMHSMDDATDHFHEADPVDGSGAHDEHRHGDSGGGLFEHHSSSQHSNAPPLAFDHIFAEMTNQEEEEERNRAFEAELDEDMADHIVE